MVKIFWLGVLILDQIVNLDKLRLERWQFYPKAKPLKKKDMMRFFFCDYQKIIYQNDVIDEYIKNDQAGKNTSSSGMYRRMNRPQDKEFNDSNVQQSS